jgi:anti-anti-sigma factor
MRRFNTTAGGSYFAVGRGAGLTGRGAHLLLLDDLLKDREEANSEIVRKNLHDWYGSVAYTRLQPGGAIINVQTRWHEDDLGGRLLREHAEDGWDVLCLPAIGEKDEAFRKAGEALWPEKYPVAALEKIRSAIGSAAFISLYQQRPSAAEGAVFQRGWWRTYSEPPSEVKRIVISVDTAFKTGAENDFSVATVWAVTANVFYLLHVTRQRLELPDLKRKLIALAGEWNPNLILIEDAASGQSLIQELKAGTALPIRPVKVEQTFAELSPKYRPSIEAMPPPTCTEGPSRPRGMPLARVVAVQKNFPNTVSAVIRPSRAYRAALVCGTPLPRASGKYRKSRSTVDANESELLSKHLRDLIATGKRKLLLNLSNPSRIDSSGVGIIVETYVSVKRGGGDLKLLSPRGRVLDVFTVFRLLELIPASTMRLRL